MKANVMPSYRIHRLRDHLRPSFRVAPHVSGVATVKPRDYEPGGTVDASGPYAAFFALKDGESPLQVGDVLEAPDGSLRIYKYVGFEEARWVVLEPKPESSSEPALQPEQGTSAGEVLVR
jgi:hypothetical protein